MIFKDLAISVGLKECDFKKGGFIWIPDCLDFEFITTIGQKPASKRDKWRITLSVNNEEFSSICDYKTARIIKIMCDAFEDYK